MYDMTTMQSSCGQSFRIFCQKKGVFFWVFKLPIKSIFSRGTHSADNAPYKSTSKIVAVVLRWLQNEWQAGTGTSGHGPWPQGKLAAPGEQTGQLLNLPSRFLNLPILSQAATAMLNLSSRFHNLPILSQAATAMPGALFLLSCQDSPTFSRPDKSSSRLKELVKGLEWIIKFLATCVILRLGEELVVNVF